MTYDAEPRMWGYLDKGVGFGARYEGVVVIAAKRTPFCRLCGPLGLLSATDLGIIASRAAIAQCGINPTEIDHIVYGNAGASSGDTFFMPRHIGLYCNLPIETPALMVQRICSSGFEAILNGAEHIATGKAEAALTGGAEGLSQMPTAIFGNRLGYRLRDVRAVDYLWEAFFDTAVGYMMGGTAENLAEKYGITRQECDEYGLRSHTEALKAQKEGIFNDEIAPVEECTIESRYFKPRKVKLYGKLKRVEQDVGPRETSMEKMAALPPVFRKNGVQTAGNSSQITDGAGTLILASARWAAERGIKPLARIVASASAGVPPEIMGIGPVPACRVALEAAGLKLDDMDFVEINEAFAAQYLAVERELGLERSRTNVHGGAIALGHPYAATGARLTMHLIYHLRRTGKRYGIASACIGGGQGTAVIVEAFHD